LVGTRGDGGVCGPGEGAAARHGAGRQMRLGATWREPMQCGLGRGCEHDWRGELRGLEMGGERHRRGTLAVGREGSRVTRLGGFAEHGSSRSVCGVA